MDDSLITAYLTRLGVEREPPSLASLIGIHRAHVERVPYETLWIHLGEPWGIDVTDSLRRIAFEGRGGYCFHLNGAFAELLKALGYNVTRHFGTVSGSNGLQPNEAGNHLALIVHDLDGADWHVDAGLGDALHEPIRLVEGLVRQGPLTFTVQQAGAEWQFGHDPEFGSFTTMHFERAACDMPAFSERHAFLATSPESHFVRTLTAQRRDATGVDILRGLVFKRVGSNSHRFTCESEKDWFALLADQYGLTLEHVSDAAKSALWVKMLTAHEAWLAKAGA